MIAPSLTRLFNLSMKLGEIPRLWKQANSQADPEIYIYICIVTISFLRDFMDYNMAQERKYCTTQLLHVYHNIIAIEIIDIILYNIYYYLLKMIQEFDWLRAVDEIVTSVR